MKFEAVKSYGSTSIPFADAVIDVSLEGGGSWRLQADRLGRASLSAAEILETFPPGQEEKTLSATLALDGQTASKSLRVSRAELERYAQCASDALVEEGNRLAKAGTLKEALARYRRAEGQDPRNPRAVYNMGLAYEKLGMPYLAVASYAKYLERFPVQNADRDALKRKAITLAKGLALAPPLPRTALDRMESARALVAKGDLYKGLWGYEMAQSAAPWWPEPYLAAATVYEFLAVQNSPAFLDSACRNLDLFLFSASTADPRSSTVRKKFLELKILKEGLNAAKTVPVR
jgi:tetratricopeptide (TPR) repeat protein